ETVRIALSLPLPTARAAAALPSPWGEGEGRGGSPSSVSGRESQSPRSASRGAPQSNPAAEGVSAPTALRAPQIANRKPHTANPKATILIVTPNGLHYTKLCLTSLLYGWRPQDELIIVDNASTDGTQEFLRAVEAANPFVRVILNDNNRGFAAANNQGL